jgi:cell wall-associated NlpC family hydrolase
MSEEHGRRIAQAALEILNQHPSYDVMKCDQLVIRAHVACGYTYSRQKLLAEEGHERVNDPKAGDVIAMTASGAGNHWGIMISSSEFVHASGDRDNVKRAKISDLRYWASNVRYLRYW